MHMARTNTACVWSVHSRRAALSSLQSYCCPHRVERVVVMASTNATLPVETAVIWSDDEDAPDAVVSARGAPRRNGPRRAAAPRRGRRGASSRTTPTTWRPRTRSSRRSSTTRTGSAGARRRRTRRRRAATTRPRPTRPRRLPTPAQLIRGKTPPPPKRSATRTTTTTAGPSSTNDYVCPYFFRFPTNVFLPSFDFFFFLAGPLPASAARLPCHGFAA